MIEPLYRVYFQEILEAYNMFGSWDRDLKEQLVEGTKELCEGFLREFYKEYIPGASGKGSFLKDNFFELLPGENRIVELRTKEIFDPQQAIIVTRLKDGR